MSQIETLKILHSNGLIQNIVLKKDLTLHILQEAKFEPHNLEFQAEYLVSQYKDLYKIDGTGMNVIFSFYIDTTDVFRKKIVVKWYCTIVLNRFRA